MDTCFVRARARTNCVALRVVSVPVQVRIVQSLYCESQQCRPWTIRSATGDRQCSVSRNTRSRSPYRPCSTVRGATGEPSLMMVWATWCAASGQPRQARTTRHRTKQHPIRYKRRQRALRSRTIAALFLSPQVSHGDTIVSRVLLCCALCVLRRRQRLFPVALNDYLLWRLPFGAYRPWPTQITI